MAGGPSTRRVLIPASLAGLQPRPRSGEIHTLQGQTMGTDWQVKLAGVAARSLPVLQAGIQAELDRVVAQMSHWSPDSDLSRFNAALAGSWHRLPPACYAVLEAGLAVAQASAGAFDPTMGALVNLWGFGPGGSRSSPPAAAEIAAARARCGWDQLQIDNEQRVLQPGGVQLDFSGIAKGYGVDSVLRYLRRCGLASALVEVGGELAGLGVKPDASPWWVALERPPGPAMPEYLLALHGLAIATSGDYRRQFRHAGQTYAHTLDPRSGSPLLGAPASVTVVHAECMQADAQATAISVLGVAAGLAYAQRQQLAVMIVERSAAGLREHLSPALAAMLE